MIFIRPSSLAEQLHIHRSTIHRWVKAGEFPKPIQLGPRAVGWLEDDIRAWMQSRQRSHTAAAEAQIEAQHIAAEAREDDRAQRSRTAKEASEDDPLAAEQVRG